MSCSVSPTTAIRFGSEGTVVVPNLCSTVAGNAAPAAGSAADAAGCESSSEPQPARRAAADSAAARMVVGRVKWGLRVRVP